jgi:fumarate hydratase class II
MKDVRTETDSFGPIDVPADKLRGAQTQRSLEHFSIGQDLIRREMITAYAILKRAAAAANHTGGRLPDQALELITHVCDEILAGQHHDMFPLHVWEHDLTLREAALQLGHVDEATFDRVVDPAKMVKPYVAHGDDQHVSAADAV